MPYFWQTRSLVYVWSSRQPAGSLWANPHKANARQFALRSGTADLGRWLTEKRHIGEDFRRAFGEPIERIDAIALHAPDRHQQRAGFSNHRLVVP